MGRDWFTSDHRCRPGQARHFTDYLAWRKRSGLASASRKLEAVALRRFLQFLHVRKIRPRNPAETLSAPRIEKYLPETLNVQAITRLLESVSAVSAFVVRFHNLGFVEEFAGNGSDGRQHQLPAFIKYRSCIGDSVRFALD